MLRMVRDDLKKLIITPMALRLRWRKYILPRIARLLIKDRIVRDDAKPL